MTSLIRLVKYFKTYFSYNIVVEFAAILKELREDRGLSQKQLSILLDISQSAIAKWELAKTEPSASAIIKLSRFFSVTCDFLLGIEN